MVKPNLHRSPGAAPVGVTQKQERLATMLDVETCDAATLRLCFAQRAAIEWERLAEEQGISRIRTLEDLRKMAAAGASRIGASASVKIVEASEAECLS